MAVVVGIVITLDFLIILLNILMALHLKKVKYLTQNKTLKFKMIKPFLSKKLIDFHQPKLREFIPSN